MLTTENKDLEVGNVGNYKIQNTVQCLLEGAKNKENFQPGFSQSISMVPSILRDVSPGCFDPKIVSIGPLHRDNKNLQACEAWKSNYMIKLINRTGFPPEEIMKSCVEKVYSSMDRIKACYIWNKIYDDAEIAQMMVLDACFILEFRYQISHINTFLFSNVSYDLVLVENQIPFFILKEIFHCTVLKFLKKNISLVEFIHPLVRRRIFRTDMAFADTKNISVDTTQHILCLLHQCYKPPQDMNIPSSSLNVGIRPSITHLDMAGVNFKPNQNSTWVMGMEVNLRRFLCCFGSYGKPTLRMPILEVHDGTEKLLRNLVAYEQMCETGSYFLSYASTMDKLVNTPNDVAKLEDSGVLINKMSSNEEVADMINNLAKHIIGKHRFDIEHWNKLNKYCNRYWPKQIAKMRSTYFNNPWNIIALFAGILLFVLTIIQTIFTIKSAT